MPTLENRARELISVESDDYFGSDTIVYYINKSQFVVQSRLINIELDSGRALRALDNFRTTSEDTPSSSTSIGSYYKVPVTIPNDFNKELYVRYNESVPLRELSASGLYALDWGNAVPTQHEGYYNIVQVSGTNTLNAYIYEAPDGSSDTVTIYYISDPTEITSSDSSFSEMPDQLENAVLYNAVSMMVSQESVDDESIINSVKNFKNIFEKELNSNLY